MTDPRRQRAERDFVLHPPPPPGEGGMDYWSFLSLVFGLAALLIKVGGREPHVRLEGPGGSPFASPAWLGCGHVGAGCCGAPNRGGGC